MLTDIQKTHIIETYKSGLSLRNTALVTGFSYVTVGKVCRDEGIVRTLSATGFARPLKSAQGHVGLLKVLHRYRDAAKRRGIVWMLSDGDAERLFSLPCHYCGCSPNQVAIPGGVRLSDRYISNGLFIYNGIDRVDSSGGYVAGNTVPCCGTCNAAKGTLSKHVFEAWILRAARHIHGREFLT